MVPLKGTSHNSLKRARDERGVVFYIKLPILSAYTRYDKKGGGMNVYYFGRFNSDLVPYLWSYQYICSRFNLSVEFIQQEKMNDKKITVSRRKR